MKRPTRYVLFALPPTLLLVAAFAWRYAAPSPEPTADLEVGQPVPAFTLPGTDGKTYTLSDFEGRYVVLEWLNFGCPYTKRHYRSGNMPALQEKYTGEDVVWLSVVSSAPGKQGHYSADKMNDVNAKYGGRQTAILLDPAGDVGMAYGARTTPHMYVIGPDGTLLYKGGIDDQPEAAEKDTRGIPSYVGAALDAAMQGEAIAVAAARPYGCGVKYAR